MDQISEGNINDIQKNANKYNKKKDEISEESNLTIDSNENTS
jgi:hypothetical protein